MRGRKKSEQMRLTILRAAAEVFSQRPFHQVLTDHLSTHLRMGKGTLYRYFASKEELYFAAIVHGLEGLRGAIDAVLRKNAPLDRAIETLARTIISYFWERRDFFVLLHRHEPKLDPGERAEWQRRREELVALVAERLAREVPRNRASAINPRLAAEMLLGMIRAVCLYRDESDRVDALAQLVTTVFLSGVRPVRALSAPRRPANARRTKAARTG